MNVPRSVADVLNDHVVFEVDCIDRMYCNVYIPGLQYAAGLVGYLHKHLGLPVASTAPLAKISDRFSAAQGVVFIGRAQEKTTVFRTEERRNSEGRTYPWIVKPPEWSTTTTSTAWTRTSARSSSSSARTSPIAPVCSFNGNHWAQHQGSCLLYT